MLSTVVFRIDPMRDLVVLVIGMLDPLLTSLHSTSTITACKLLVRLDAWICTFFLTIESKIN